jgi:hypothetical protein
LDGRASRSRSDILLRNGYSATGFLGKVRDSDHTPSNDRRHLLTSGFAAIHWSRLQRRRTAFEPNSERKLDAVYRKLPRREDIPIASLDSKLKAKPIDATVEQPESITTLPKKTVWELLYSARDVGAAGKEIEVVRKSIAWRFTWGSSYLSGFKYDFDVSFLPKEIAAARVTAWQISQATTCTSPTTQANLS